MRRDVIYLVLTATVCCGLLLADAVPGLLMTFLCGGRLVPSCVILPVLLGGMLAWFAVGRSGVRTTAVRRWPVVTACVLGAATAVCLWAELPKRVSLYLYRAEFEALLPNAPPPDDDVEFRHQLGPFVIDRIGSDRADGVWFRTGDHADGLGPDTMSHGFFYRPHRESCPFGRAKYADTHLFGDWYAFSVSDD